MDAYSRKKWQVDSFIGIDSENITYFDPNIPVSEEKINICHIFHIFRDVIKM